MIDHIIGIAIVAINDRYALVNCGATLLLAPYAIATQASGDGWHMKRHTLEWSIAPWLVVAREDGQIKTYEQVVVWQVEYAIIAIPMSKS